MDWLYSSRKSEKLTTAIFRSERSLVDGKKIKEVYANNEALSHAWASGNVPRGVSGNMFFEEGVIYSYGRHYQAAKIFKSKNAKNGGLVLLNSDSYSSSTNKHLYTIRRAVNHLQVIRVPDVSPENEVTHERNTDYLHQEIYEKLDSIYSMKGHFCTFEVIDSVKKLNLYLETFKLPGKINLESKAFGEFIGLANKMVELRGERKKALEEKRKVKEEEGNKALRESYKEDLRALEENFPLVLKNWKTGNINDNELISETFLSYGVKRPFGRFSKERMNIILSEGMKAEIRAVLEDRFRDSLILWRRGEVNSASMVSKIPWNFRQILGEEFSTEGEFSFLRVVGNKVETSHNAEVPLEESITLLKMILRKEARAGHKIGNYTLISVKEERKVIQIGCHKILLEEALEVLGPYLNRERLSLVEEVQA